METCPKCLRPLRSANAWHYCEKVELDALFVGKQPIVSDLFDALLLEVIDWDGVAFSATKNCIVFTRSKAFLVVKPMQKALNLKFYLSHYSELAPIFKSTEWSGKFETQIRLHDLDDLTPTVMQFLRTSYAM